MKLHEMRKERDHSESWWWIKVFSCVLKRVHHEQLSKRCENSWMQLPLLKIRTWTCNQIHVQNLWAVPPFSIFMTSAQILFKINVWNIIFISSAELKVSAQQEDAVIEGRRRALESALPVELSLTMGLSDPICWSEHPSAVFVNK